MTTPVSAPVSMKPSSPTIPRTGIPLRTLTGLVALAACAPAEAPVEGPAPEEAVEEAAEVPLEERIRAPFAVEVFGAPPSRERPAAASQATDGWLAIEPAPGVPSDDPADEADFEGDPTEREIADPEPGEGEEGMPVHEVREGESFWSIAGMYGVEMDELADANLDVDPGRLQPGMLLRIPTVAGRDPWPEDVDAAEERQEPSAFRTYTVQPGDTLWNIARRFGVSEARIREANDMTGSIVRIGETLVIPMER